MAKTVGEILKVGDRPIVSITADVTVRFALESMAFHHIGALQLLRTRSCLEYSLSAITRDRES